MSREVFPAADWRDSRIVQVDFVDRVPQTPATSCRTLLGCQTGPLRRWMPSASM